MDRNEHSYLGDFKAELDLYLKAGKLVEFLSTWTPSRGIEASLPERMEELWIDLYERGYIELKDVEAIQLWSQALIGVGYKFPSPVREPVRNTIVVMGQFNYGDTPPEQNVFWTQKSKLLRMWLFVVHSVRTLSRFNITAAFPRHLLITTEALTLQ